MLPEGPGPPWRPRTPSPRLRPARSLRPATSTSPTRCPSPTSWTPSESPPSSVPSQGWRCARGVTSVPSLWQSCPSLCASSCSFGSGMASAHKSTPSGMACRASSPLSPCLRLTPSSSAHSFAGASRSSGRSQSCKGTSSHLGASRGTLLPTGFSSKSSSQCRTQSGPTSSTLSRRVHTCRLQAWRCSRSKWPHSVRASTRQPRRRVATSSTSLPTAP
mmetsp:Transcript_26940/g.72634  ORF Transcript_26940/g.72634 Transcript_26940/m.72634 type:complete len:218 (-) Transcript_26940:448-1101(-)